MFTEHELRNVWRPEPMAPHSWYGAVTSPSSEESVSGPSSFALLMCLILLGWHTQALVQGTLLRLVHTGFYTNYFPYG